MSEREYDIADALASLRAAVRTSVPAPAAAVLRARAEQRQRARQLGAVAVAAVVVATVLLTMSAVVQRNAISPDPANGTRTPTPAPTVPVRPDRPVPPYPVTRVDDPIARVDWAGATVTVPSRGPDCPSGQLRFRGGVTAGYPQMGLMVGAPRPPVFGDLTGDGRAEAVIEAVCAGDDQADHTHSQLLVVGRQSSGALVALGWAGPKGWGIVYGFWLAGDRLVIEPEPTGTYHTGQTLEYRWDGGRFRQQDTGWVGIGPLPDRLAPGIDLGPAEGYVARALGCWGGKVQLQPDGRVVAAVPGDASFKFDQPVSAQHVLDLAGDGQRHVLAAVVCEDRVQVTVDSDGVSAPVVRGQGVLVIERHPTGSFRAVDLVPVPLDRRLAQWTFERGRLTVVSYLVSDGTEAPAQRWVWNGVYFQPEA
jgi:hypothetical protein